MGVSTDAAADRIRRLETVVDRYGPFVGLAVGASITALAPIEPPTLAFWARTGALMLALAGWSAGFVFRRRAGCAEPAAGPRAGVVYVTGFVVLMAGLVHQSPWFAFLALPGYSLAFGYLRGRWRIVGTFAVATLHAYSTVGGGYTGLTPTVVLIVLPIALIITGVSLTFGTVAGLIGEQSQRRAETIEELNEANRRLSDSLAENAALHTRLLAQAREAGVLDERARMAREIHDTLAQGLTGIVTQLEAADTAEETVRRRHVDTARALARESLTEARRSVDALAPGRLAEARLPDAITDMAKEWAETGGVVVHVEVTGEPMPLLPEIEVTLFRVAQEALTNVGKHAAAARAGLTLSYMDDVVVLDVRDDGAGFDTTVGADGAGFGLLAMEQRVRRVSGEFAVESTLGEGTAVSASVPAIPAERGDA